MNPTDELASDAILDRAYAWLCEQRRRWPDAADVWWQELEGQYQTLCREPAAWVAHGCTRVRDRLRRGLETSGHESEPSGFNRLGSPSPGTIPAASTTLSRVRIQP